MKIEKFTLDTNILIYAIDRQAKHRHEVAVDIIKRMVLNSLDCILTLQSLSEFYYACTRKKLFDHHIAYEQISDWQTLFPVVTATPAVLNAAIKSVKTHQISFWDAMLLQTARSAGVTTILTEDLSHEQIINGVQIINPFISSFEVT